MHIKKIIENENENEFSRDKIKLIETKMLVHKIETTKTTKNKINEEI